MNTATELRNRLRSIDHKGYPAYKDLKGQYQFGDYVLSIDHVQGDPFAAPSRLSVRVEKSKAGFPAAYYDTPAKRITLQDHLTRLFGRWAAGGSFQAKGSGKNQNRHAAQKVGAPAAEEAADGGESDEAPAKPQRRGLFGSGFRLSNREKMQAEKKAAKEAKAAAKGGADASDQQ